MQKYEDAIALYTQILKTKDNQLLQNNLTEALVAQGQVDLGIKNYTKATDELERAISRGTKDSAAYFGLAQAYRACGLNEKAAQNYEKAISMSPEKTNYSSEYAEFIAEINANQKTISGTETPQTNNENSTLPSISLDENSENIVNAVNLEKIKI